MQTAAVPAATGGWTPYSLGAALVAWWNADDHGTGLMTDDGAGLISSWTDRVAGIAVTGTTTKRPTWAISSFNGKAGLSFDGAANCLTSTSFAALPTGAVPSELFATIDQQRAMASSGQNVVLRYGAGTGAADRAIERTTSASANRTLESDGTTINIDQQVDLSGRHIIGGAWDGTIMTGWVDGRPAVPGIITVASLATGTARLTIGASNGAVTAAFFDGVLRQALITLKLTRDQRAQLDGWLAWDGGIPDVLPSGTPFKNRAP